MSIIDCLRKLGATSPETAVTTDKVVKMVNDGRRLVYTELLHSTYVRRVDIETEWAVDANGWYTILK